VLTEGVDFRLAETPPRVIGRKAMAANLSDIAAMAGRPIAAVVGVVLPLHEGKTIAEELYRGLRDVADAFQVPVVGGDTNAWAGGLVVSVTVLGEASPRGAVRRSGAVPGDWVFVTGPLGGSIRGRHLSPTPRIREALALHEFAPVHAMADISDGLAADLHHILTESHCGAILEAASIPIHPDALELAHSTGRTPLEHALGDGEDFELVFTVSPTDGERLVRARPVPGLTKIGECLPSGYWLNTPSGRQPLTPVGWSHPV
jgi:thiamine-monophosphate kinase